MVQLTDVFTIPETHATVRNMIADDIARTLTSPTTSARAKKRARDLMRELMDRPFSAAEAAEKLGISKPTAIKWLRAGLLRRAVGTSENDNLYDAANVLAARSVLQGLKLHGSLAERAKVLASLPERLFWEARPEELAELVEAVHDADRGKLMPVSDEELERGRTLLAAQRRRARQRGLRRRARRAPARAA